MVKFLDRFRSPVTPKEAPAPEPPDPALEQLRAKKEKNDKQKELDAYMELYRTLVDNAVSGTVNPFAQEIKETGLIAGQPVEEVEARMRNKYLGTNDSLPNLLEMFQNQVNKLGLSHIAIVAPLQQIDFKRVSIYISSPEKRGDDFDIEINGQDYIVKYVARRGFKKSPFIDPDDQNAKYNWKAGTQSDGGSFEITRKSDGESIDINPLLIHFIRDFGYYGGSVDVYPLEAQKVLLGNHLFAIPITDTNNEYGKEQNQGIESAVNIGPKLIADFFGLTGSVPANNPNFE